MRHESKSLIKKVIMWRILSIVITYAAIIIYLGDVKSATWFTLFLHLLLTIANYIFEILWSIFFKKKAINTSNKSM